MNIELLEKEFRKILDHEKRARHFYDHYIDQVDDKKIKNILAGIRDDEIRHVRIAEELIKCLD